MSEAADASSSKYRYGPVTFAAAMANILVVEVVTWYFLPWFLLAVLTAPFLLANLTVAAVLATRGGRVAAVGRGMLIGWLSGPLSLAIFIPTLLAASGLGWI